MRMTTHIHPHIFRGDRKTSHPQFEFVGFSLCHKLFCCSEQSGSEVTSPLCSLCSPQHQPFVCSEFIMNITGAAERQS